MKNSQAGVKLYSPKSDIYDSNRFLGMIDDADGQWVSLADYDALMEKAVQFAEILTWKRGTDGNEAIEFLQDPAVQAWRAR